MKLHDLRPAEGSRTPRTRVGRGIAAGKGKTAGRGTKGQKARAGGSIPPWFEGGQTPLHMRIPKLRGFKNRFKIAYEVVNVGAIEAALERGRLAGESAAHSSGKSRSKAAAQITVNQDLLRDAGLVRSLDKPLKILGGGALTSSLFVVADAFTASARTKIEAAGGAVSVLEVPTRPMKAIGVEPATVESGDTVDAAAAAAPAAPAPSPAVEEAEATPEPKARKPRARKGGAATADAPAADTAAADTPATAEAGADPAADAAVDDEAEATSGDDA